MPTELTGPTTRKPQREITGRFVLICMVAFFGIVTAVNGVMMTLAIRSFPGIDPRNGYERSQGYNAEIAAARRQAESGVNATTGLRLRDGSLTIEATLTDRTGTGLAQQDVEVALLHPSDRRKDRQVKLNEIGSGRYQGTLDSFDAGSWIVEIRATRDGQQRYYSRARQDLK